MPHEFHEFSLMFPLLSGQELDDLVADIAANGQREPIVMLDDKILDGRNRYLACQKLHIKPRLRNLTCIDGDPLNFVWSANVARRHLSQSAIALAAAARAKFKVGVIGRGRGKMGPQATSNENGYLPPILIGEAAKLAECSRDTIKRAKTILDYGTDTEKAAIQTGKMKIKTAYNLARHRKKATEQATQDDPVNNFSPKAGLPIKVPANYTPEGYTRKGLDLENDGLEIAEVAKQLKICDSSYRKMREIVLIADRKDLSPKDRTAADAALKSLNLYGQAKAHQAIEPIAIRVWGKSQKRRKNIGTETDRLHEFEKKIEIISHVCATKIEIPQLGKEQIDYTITTLEESIQGLKGLIKDIKEIYSV